MFLHPWVRLRPVIILQSQQKMEPLVINVKYLHCQFLPGNPNPNFPLPSYQQKFAFKEDCHKDTHLFTIPVFLGPHFRRWNNPDHWQSVYVDLTIFTAHRTIFTELCLLFFFFLLFSWGVKSINQFTIYLRVLYTSPCICLMKYHIRHLYQDFITRKFILQNKWWTNGWPFLMIYVPGSRFIML